MATTKTPSYRVVRRFHYRSDKGLVTVEAGGRLGSVPDDVVKTALKRGFIEKAKADD